MSSLGNLAEDLLDFAGINFRWKMKGVSVTQTNKHVSPSNGQCLYYDNIY